LERQLSFPPSYTFPHELNGSHDENYKEQRLFDGDEEEDEEIS
jgi:hypothetical protein